MWRKWHFVASVEIQKVKHLSTFWRRQKSLAVRIKCSIFADEFA